MLAFLPSPLLGPATWSAVAAEARARGHAAAVVPSAAWEAPATPAEHLDRLLAGLPDGPLTLVPHSNAGLYVAAVAAAREVAAVVFVDALLPPGSGPARAAGDEFYAFLAARADAAGLLPPWTGWWDEDLSPLFPDEDVRRRVEAEQPRLPLAYFRAPLPAPPGWAALPCAYLAFGDTYEAERARAAAAGWPAETLPGEHLHQLVDPPGVAAAVLRLRTALEG